MQEVADLVVLVDRARLVVDVVEEPLKAGVAGGVAAAAVARRAGVLLDRAVGVVEVDQEVRELIDGPEGAAVRPDSGRGSRRGRGSGPGGRGSRPCRACAVAGSAAALNRGSVWVRRLSWGAAALRSFSSGVCCSARLPRAAGSGGAPAGSRAGAGSCGRCRRGPRPMRSTRRSAFSMNSITSSRRSVSAGDDLVGVDVELGDRRVLAGEDREGAVEARGGPERRGGSPR